MLFRTAYYAMLIRPMWATLANVEVPALRGFIAQRPC